MEAPRDFSQFRNPVTGRYPDPPRRKTRQPDKIWLHVLLFLFTFFCTTWTWAVAWSGKAVPLNPLYLLSDPRLLADSLSFSVGLLFFLTVHEFGHYFAARYHRIDTSLPYYIPLPLLGIGTFGAVIRIREPLPSARKLFDVGAGGPLAGFVAALGVLLYALMTLPDPTYLLELPGHELLQEHIRQFGTFPDRMLVEDPNQGALKVGLTPLYWALTQVFPNVPPVYEMYHYPVLFAGWLGLFFTALNLLPVGQLDGGHILYALVGPVWQARIARAFFLILALLGGIGLINAMEAPDFQQTPYLGWLAPYAWFVLAAFLFYCLNRLFRGDLRIITPVLTGLMVLIGLAHYLGESVTQFGYTFWLVWCLLILFVLKVDHPPVLYQERLTRNRRLLGVLSFVIFILCFSLRPLYMG